MPLRVARCDWTRKEAQFHDDHSTLPRADPPRPGAHRRPRVPASPTPLRWPSALAGGGIRAVELTFTTPDVLDHLSAAASAAGYGCRRRHGADRPTRPSRRSTPAPGSWSRRACGSARSSQVATDGRRPGADRRAHPHRGASRPSSSEPTAVKSSPPRCSAPATSGTCAARTRIVALCPIRWGERRERSRLPDAGAVAVTAGTDVVPPDLVAAGAWAEIRRWATAFVAACGEPLGHRLTNVSPAIPQPYRIPQIGLS